MSTELYVPHLFGYSGCFEKQNAYFSAKGEGILFLEKHTLHFIFLFIPVVGITGKKYLFLNFFSGF